MRDNRNQQAVAKPKLEKERKMKYVVIALVCVLCIGIVASASEVTLYLEWFKNQTHSPFIVADALGFYEAAGVDVTILPGSDDPTLGMKAVASGRADFALVEVPAFLRAVIENKIDLVAIGAFHQHLPYVWFTKPDSGIKTFADFAGHRINMLCPCAPEAFLSRILEINGVNPGKDVEWVYGGFGVAPIISGQADIGQGYINWEPYEVERLFDGVNIWKVGDIADIYGLVIVASPDYLEANPEAALSFLTATMEGYAYVRANERVAAELVYEAVPDLALVDIQQGISADIEYLWSTEGLNVSLQLEMTTERWDETLRWVYFTRLVSYVVPVASLFTNEYLK